MTEIETQILRNLIAVMEAIAPSAYNRDRLRQEIIASEKLLTEHILAEGSSRIAAQRRGLTSNDPSAGGRSALAPRK